MSTLLAFGLTNAVCAAFLAALALALGRGSRRPALAHALWVLVLLKLVTPPLFRPALPLLPAEESDVPSEKAPAPSEPPARVQYLDIGADITIQPANAPWPRVPTPVNLTLEVPPPAQAASPPAQAAPPPEPIPPPAPQQVAGLEEIAALLGLVWLAGALVVYARALVQAVRFQRLLRYGRPATASLQEELARLAGRMGLRRCPQLWLIPGALPPLVWGWLGPVRIFFPMGLLERLGEDERLSLLAHELGHVRRGDHRVRWLEVLAGGLYWWYPLVWLALRHLQQREEECCDALAVEQASARVYATAILETVDFLAEARPRLPALASGLSSARLLEERLTLLFTTPLPGRLAGLARLALGSLALVFLPLFPHLCRAEKELETPVVLSLEGSAESVIDRTDLFTLAGHSIDLLDPENDVHTLEISADGQRIAVGTGGWGKGGHVRVQDLVSRRTLWEEDRPDPVGALRFLGNNNRLAWAGWDRRFFPGDWLSRLNGFRPPARLTGRMAYSPDGRLLATAAGRDQVKLWDALTGRALARLPAESLDFYCVNFSRDGQRLAVGGSDRDEDRAGLVLVYDLTSRQPIARLSGHTRAVLDVSFAPGNTYLATASADRSVRVWDAERWETLHTLNGHTEAVECLNFTSDARFLATGGRDRTIRLWDVVSSKQQAVLEGHPGAVRQLAFTPDDRYLISSGAGESVLLWDVAARRKVATLHGATVRPDRAHLLGLALSADGQTLALARDDHTIHLHQALSGKWLRTLSGHQGVVTSLVWSPDGTLLASGSVDHTVRLWDPRTGRLLCTLSGHTSPVRTLAMSPDGRTLASGGDDNIVRLWETSTGRPVRTFRGSRAGVRAVAFSPDGNTLVSGGTDQAIWKWSLVDPKQENLWIEQGAIVVALSFSPDGKRLASAGDDGTARIWRVADGTLYRTLHDHNSLALNLAWSPGGNTLATAGVGQTIQLWNADTGTLRGSLAGHTDAVTGLNYAHDGTRIYSTSLDQTARFWSLEPARPRTVNGSKEYDLANFFTTDGTTETRRPFLFGLQVLPAGR
jgi:WD40 repeat protein/beta-lactamase regulating signal transducer with metallopeptidase domain